MRIKDYRCNCGFDEFFFLKDTESNKIGIYCERCGKRFKWSNKDESNLYKYQQLNNKINVDVGIKLLDPDISLPIYKFDTDAGMDIRSAEDVYIKPGDTLKIRTGISVELPPGYTFEVSPRSGVTSKTKLRVILGTIDACYRGEIGIIIDNVSDASLVSNQDRVRTIEDNDPFYHGTYHIRKGDRIAQLKLKVVPKCNWIEKDNLTITERGTGGFGHTGVY